MFITKTYRILIFISKTTRYTVLSQHFSFTASAWKTHWPTHLLYVPQHKYRKRLSAFDRHLLLNSVSAYFLFVVCQVCPTWVNRERNEEQQLLTGQRSPSTDTSQVMTEGNSANGNARNPNNRMLLFLNKIPSFQDSETRILTVKLL